MSSRPGSRPWTHQSRSFSATDPSARPWTGQSRPTTARPQTAGSVRHEGSYVVAVLEGRGVSREVGIAALDKDTGKVMLVQVIYLLRTRQYMRVLTRHAALGGRLSDLCEVPTSNAHPPAMFGPDSGHVPLGFGCCVGAVWKTSAVDLTSGGIYS